MAPDERDGEFEDLFDDLDSFFEPEEDASGGTTGQAEASAGKAEPGEGEPEATGGGALFGYGDEEEGTGEEPALSVDDLRKAPPEYRDLLGARGEEEERDLVGVALGEMPGPEDEGEPSSSEPAMAEVEAAA